MGHGLDDRAHVLGHRTENEVKTRLCDAGLLSGNIQDGRTESVGMVEGNPSDGRGDWRLEYVGGIESSAYPYFDNADVDTQFTKGKPSGQSRRFEERHGGIDGESAREVFGEPIVLERTPVDSNPFRETAKVR